MIRYLQPVFFTALILPFSAFATNGYFSHGYGLKAKGMGGVGIALPQDSLAAASNPAGMVFLGSRADVGLDLFMPDREAKIQGNGVSAFNQSLDGNGDSLFFIPELGYNKMLSSQASAGFSIYGNGGMNTNYENGVNLFGSTGEAGVNLEQLFISPTYAYLVKKGHALGVSVNLVRQTFEAKGLQNFAGASSSASNLTNNGKDSSLGMGVTLGWLSSITPQFSVGAMYRSKVNMGKLDRYQGLFANQGQFDIPSMYGIGAHFHATPKVTLAMDLMRINYSEVDSIANSISRFSTAPLGANGGPGFGWEDITVLKVGALVHVSSKWDVRAGFNHGKNPIPEQETLFNVLAPGVVEDHLTLGATYHVDSHKELTLGYMRALENEVKGVGSIPSAGFGGGNADIKMSQNSFGVAFGWKY